MKLSMLVAYDEDGNVVATLDHLVQFGPDGKPERLVDFEAIEEQGGKFRLRPDGSEGVWYVPGAVGSGTWPEWLTSEPGALRVQVDRRFKHPIRAIVHRSGHRRDRDTINAAIAQRIAAANGKPADIRDLVGGPSRPLQLDREGKTVDARALFEERRRRRKRPLPGVALSQRP